MKWHPVKNVQYIYLVMYKLLYMFTTGCHLIANNLLADEGPGRVVQRMIKLIQDKCKF